MDQAFRTGEIEIDGGYNSLSLQSVYLIAERCGKKTTKFDWTFSENLKSSQLLKIFKWMPNLNHLKLIASQSKTFQIDQKVPIDLNLKSLCIQTKPEALLNFFTSILRRDSLNELLLVDCFDKNENRKEIFNNLFEKQKSIKRLEIEYVDPVIFERAIKFLKLDELKFQFSSYENFKSIIESQDQLKTLTLFAAKIDENVIEKISTLFQT